MISATRRPVLYAVASGLLLCATVASDWPIGFLHEFWATNGMVTNIVAGLLFVLVTATIFNFWTSRREAARLRAVVLATSHALAVVPLTQRRVMWTLAHGDYSAWAAETTLTADQRDQLLQAMGRCRLPVVALREIRTEGRTAPDLGTRLTQLVQDSGWVEVAYLAFGDLTRRSRDVLAQWSPLLVATQDSSGLLLALSEQVEEMARILSWLRRRNTRAPADADADAGNIALWRHAFTNATALEETLRRELGRPGDAEYSYRERRLLEGTELKALVTSRGEQGMLPLRVHPY